MKSVIVVPGLFGGVAKKYYQPITEVFGASEFTIIRGDSEWNPYKLADEIRQIKGEKIVVCLSLGAMVGNILAHDDSEDMEIYYICPFIGAWFNQRSYPKKLRLFFRSLAFVGMVITWPFKWHRWYPLFGGTRPDGHFLSVYSLFQQLYYAFSETPPIKAVAGVVYSAGDTTVSPKAVRIVFPHAVEAKRADGGGPEHVNFREDGRGFGRHQKADASLEPGEDGKAYALALKLAAKKEVA